MTKVGNESMTPFCSSMNCGSVGVRGCFMLLLLSRNGENGRKNFIAAVPVEPNLGLDSC